VRNAHTGGLVSISFDDFPASAGSAGAEILEEQGYRGTYYVSGCYAGKSLFGIDYFVDEDLARLRERGHEIGCHTFSHLRLPHCSAEQIEDDLERNAEYVRSLLPGYRMTSFAYPNGAVSPLWKRRIRRRFESARGIRPGSNGRRVDLAHVRSWPFYRGFGRARMRALLDEAQQGSWISFFTHDVAAAPSAWGCTPEELRELVAEVCARGLPCVPVRDATARIRAGT